MHTDSTLQPIYDNQWYTHPETGTRYPPNYPRNGIDGLHQVTETDPPLGDVVITGFIINENYEQVWNYRKKTADEIADAQQAALKTQIMQLEAKQTPRLLREAAVGSTAVDERTGLTAMETLETLESQIAQLRSTLNATH